MTEGSGETRLSDQIAYHRSLCDAAAKQPGHWFEPEGGGVIGLNRGRFLRAYSPDVVSALLDVAEAAQGIFAEPYVTIRADGPVAQNSARELLDRVSKVRDALATLSQRMEER